MLRALIAVEVLMLVCGCSAVNRNVEDVVEVSTVIPCETPPFIQGDPVYHAEMAIDIAEYVLAKKGYDCRGYKANVSFCDGVYTVAFVTGDERTGSEYTVDIEADTSMVLGVKVTTRGLRIARRG